VYTTIIAAKSGGPEPGCSNTTCHFSGAGPAEGALDMSSQPTAYKSLVNVAAAGPLCSSKGLTRVVPGNASVSLMYNKVHDASPPCGVQMPYAGPPYDLAPLPADEQSLIESWINAGAQNN
jgi:predicted CxxxxCH...CXXCH cytochrome family protein